MKKINIKKLLFYIGITIFIGAIPSLLAIKEMKDYNLVIKPPLSPPSIVFPIAWTILFILMGIAIYRVVSSKGKYIEEAKLVYFLQLLVNALWTPIFFLLKQYLFAFIWILILIILVIYLITLFNKNDKISSYLLIPYLLWLFFAAYLNFGVFILN